ncbi:hypothetical protein BS47DRAFT_1029904 [Hydnum rufescens UP504]|uniref:Uncharacterized protein n=1 Tax=Hydnum rufescens UP504 TaxID=1448309 RepID=A0A9P6AVQ9_9AGAM|nr:hypothetical protein BS47DRAFT_1029904 [Hydnum rufescens UP504]
MQEKRMTMSIGVRHFTLHFEFILPSVPWHSFSPRAKSSYRVPDLTPSDRTLTCNRLLPSILPSIYEGVPVYSARQLRALQGVSPRLLGIIRLSEGLGLGFDHPSQPRIHTLPHPGLPSLPHAFPSRPANQSFAHIRPPFCLDPIFTLENLWNLHESRS